MRGEVSRRLDYCGGGMFVVYETAIVVRVSAQERQLRKLHVPETLIEHGMCTQAIIL